MAECEMHNAKCKILGAATYVQRALGELNKARNHELVESRFRGGLVEIRQSPDAVRELPIKNLKFEISEEVV